MTPKQWARTLGEARYAREDATTGAATSDDEEWTRTSAVSTARWPAIVAGMRRLTDAYNTGARRVVLRLLESAGPPTVMVSAGEELPLLTAVLDGTVVCIQTRDASGSCNSEIRLHADRDDSATAAYILQNWMQRL